MQRVVTAASWNVSKHRFKYRRSLESVRHSMAAPTNVMPSYRISEVYPRQAVVAYEETLSESSDYRTSTSTRIFDHPRIASEGNHGVGLEGLRFPDALLLLDNQACKNVTTNFFQSDMNASMTEGGD